MSVKLEVVEIGDELGVISADELAASVGAKQGDTIVARGENGVFHLAVLRNTEQKPES
ncbi:MAG: hypothetical protein WBQ17_04460 [Rhizomicrobium sp.]